MPAGEPLLALGEISGRMPAGDWVLILGGITREGNRRARRAARAARDSGHSVVWFDGVEEEHEATGERVALFDGEDLESGGDRLTIVGYAVEERSHWLHRMVNVSLAAEEPRAVDTSTRTGRYWARARYRLATLIRAFRKKVLRRLSQVFRGLIGWRLVRGDMRALHRGAPPPVQIVYGDDFSLTQAWHAARLWPDAEVGMELGPR